MTAVSSFTNRIGRFADREFAALHRQKQTIAAIRAKAAFGPSKAQLSTADAIDAPPHTASDVELLETNCLNAADVIKLAMIDALECAVQQGAR